MAVGDLGVPSKLVLILSIFIGGGESASTAGGIKLLRLLLRRTVLCNHAIIQTRLAGDYSKTKTCSEPCW